jgi:ParB family chromosome partitioning protein
MTIALTKDPKSLAPNPFNSNRVGADNMRKLKQSITDLGFVTAVVVRELANGTLQILGGHHRVEAAIELGLKEVPVLNLGQVDDIKARKIGLVDNSRYGTDDTIQLAKVLEEIGATTEDLAMFLPFTETDFDMVRKSVDINLDDLELDMPEDDEPAPPIDRTEKPPKTHDVLRFRVSLRSAEKIRKLIEKTVKEEGLDEGDELTAHGDALAFLLLNSSDEE